MYIKIFFAKINFTVFIIFLVTTIYGTLIFPYIMSVTIFYDKKTGRVNFLIILYGFVKIASGYIRRKNTKLIIHYSDTKALIFDLKNFKPKGNLKHLKSLELLSLYSVVSFEENIKNYYLSTALAVIDQSLLPVLKSKKYFMSMDNSIEIQDRAQTRFLLNFTICFNVLVIIKIILKFLWSKK